MNSDPVAEYVLSISGDTPPVPSARNDRCQTFSLISDLYEMFADTESTNALSTCYDNTLPSGDRTP